ncbi:hypothetical protein BJ912DRAFT_181536 [Pholiota molesta]|nr:hypothetical protein BJ912DRAFT_181536 [Pholiota molesta]
MCKTKCHAPSLDDRNAKHGRCMNAPGVEIDHDPTFRSRVAPQGGQPTALRHLPLWSTSTYAIFTSTCHGSDIDILWTDTATLLSECVVSGSGMLPTCMYWINVASYVDHWRHHLASTSCLCSRMLAASTTSAVSSPIQDMLGTLARILQPLLQGDADTSYLHHRREQATLLATCTSRWTSPSSRFISSPSTLEVDAGWRNRGYMIAMIDRL